MRFFSKPHIFYAKSNILDPQIILFDDPPSQPDQYQHNHDPKSPARKFIVPAPLVHRYFDLHLIWYAVPNLNLSHLVEILKFE